MKLLIITQKVDKDDAILGFFHEWIKEFSKNCESVVVICLEMGMVDLPNNVKVFSLGKELRERSDLGNFKRSDLEEQFQKIKFAWRFYKYIWQERKNYDAVFVHMNQVYVILGGFFWKAWHKKISLWYVHRQASFSLWLATKFVDNIFTSSPESFTVKSDKMNYIGHGIDSSKFSNNVFNHDNSRITIVHIGRISEIKDLKTLILAGAILKEKINNLSIELYGGPSNDIDREYEKGLKKIVREKNLEDVVLFKGPISNTEISGVYSRANLSVNMSPKGGWDKVVIESLMAKCPVFASNLALKPVFGDYGHMFLFKHKDPLDLANEIEVFLAPNNKEAIVKELHDNAIAQYDIKNLVKKIVKKL
jgi:glycosyltransferase involved in cell wall biosynthesis